MGEALVDAKTAAGWNFASGGGLDRSGGSPEMETAFRVRARQRWDRAHAAIRIGMLRVF